jgi:F-type H+-transporting ATPase subunit b
MVSISFDTSLLIQLVNFLLLMAALNFLLYKPLRKVLAERRELFDRLKEEASKAKAALDDGENEKARQNAESLRAALSLKNELVQKGLAEEKAILAQAQAQAAERTLDARARLAESQAQAREALARESEGIARSMAEKILGRSL